jgi:hypothetical protein
MPRSEPTTVSITRDQIENGIHDFTTKEQALAFVRRAGLPIPTAPPEMNYIQDEWDSLVRRAGGICNVPFAMLGDFLDRWTGVVSFARWLEAEADIESTLSLEIRDHIKKQLYLVQTGTNREMRDAAVYAEPLYIEWNLKYTTAFMNYKAVRQLREGYEMRVNAISREITRRGNDNLDTRRTVNRGNQA